MCDIERKGNNWEVVISRKEIDNMVGAAGSELRNNLKKKYAEKLKTGGMSMEAIEESVTGITKRLEEQIFKATRKESRLDGQYILDVKDPLLKENILSVPVAQAPA